MNTQPPLSDEEQANRQRASARRLALILGGVSAVCYAAFILLMAVSK